MTPKQITPNAINDFTSYMQRYPDLYKDLAETVEQYTTLDAPRIIDLGSGPGLLSREIKRRLPHANILGLDPSHHMIKKAHQLLRTPPPLINATTEYLPFKDNTVDLLVTRYTLTYWTNPHIGLSEIHRVLKPRAIFIIEALNKNYPWWMQLLTRIHMTTKQAPSSVIRYHLDAYHTAYTKSQAEHYLTQHGFRLLKSEGKPKEWRFQVIAEKPTEKNINTSQT